MVDDDRDPPLDDLDESQAEKGGFATKMLGDLARRALMTGIGAVFMSEETLKGSLSDMKLPKEAMNYVVGQADRTKKEIVATIARETREFLSKLEVEKVLGRALVGATIEIQTKIRILPKEGGGVGLSVVSDTAKAPDDDERPKKRSKKKRGESPGDDENDADD